MLIRIRRNPEVRQHKITLLSFLGKDSRPIDTTLGSSVHCTAQMGSFSTVNSPFIFVAFTYREKTLFMGKSERL